MNTATKASWTGSWLKQPNEYELGLNCCQRQTQQSAEMSAGNTLLLLPFEMMRQYLESVMLQQLEIAAGLYFKQAKEMDNAFMTHVDKFEVTIKTELEKYYST